MSTGRYTKGREADNALLAPGLAPIMRGLGQRTRRTGRLISVLAPPEFSMASYSTGTRQQTRWARGRRPSQGKRQNERHLDFSCVEAQKIPGWAWPWMAP